MFSNVEFVKLISVGVSEFCSCLSIYSSVSFPSGLSTSVALLVYLPLFSHSSLCSSVPIAFRISVCGSIASLLNLI